MEDIYAQAKKIIYKNLKKGVVATPEGEFEYTFVCPSRAIYPHQWLWDSCFHIIVTSGFNRQLAKAELRTLASQVQAEGFIPQITVWEAGIRFPVLGSIARWMHDRNHYTKVTQPPVLGIALEEYYRHSGDRELLKELLPPVKRHYEYFAGFRDPDRDGLISIVLPIESGMDHSPAYDEVVKLREPTAFNYHVANMVIAAKYSRMDWDIVRILDADIFSVEDLSVNCIYANGLRSVSRLCKELGDPDASRFASLAEQTERSIVERCYNTDDGVFYSLHSKADLQIPVKTIASLMPLLLESLPGRLVDEIVDHHLLNPEFFWLRYPLPSVSMHQEQFQACSGPLRNNTSLLGRFRRKLESFHRIWRGPTWVNTNWFIARGLRLHGKNDIADLLTEKTVEMIRHGGFWEYYNPLTGQGLGAEELSWSTLVIDMLENCREKDRILAETAPQLTLDPLITTPLPASPKPA